MRTAAQWPRKTLVENNKRWALENKQLHPTRGWRKITIKGTLAQDITARLKAGVHGLDNLMIKDILQGRVYL